MMSPQSDSQSFLLSWGGIDWESVNVSHALTFLTFPITLVSILTQWIYQCVLTLTLIPISDLRAVILVKGPLVLTQTDSLSSFHPSFLGFHNIHPPQGLRIIRIKSHCGFGPHLSVNVDIGVIGEKSALSLLKLSSDSLLYYPPNIISKPTPCQIHNLFRFTQITCKPVFFSQQSGLQNPLCLWIVFCLGAKQEQNTLYPLNRLFRLGSILVVYLINLVQQVFFSFYL